MRVGVGRVMAWVQGEGTQRRGHRAQRVLMFFCVVFFPPPIRTALVALWASMGPFLAAAITANN